MTPPVFDAAAAIAIAHAHRLSTELRLPVVVVRDLMGRLRLMVDDRPAPLDAADPRLVLVTEQLQQGLGAYASSGGSVLLGHTLFAPDEVLGSGDATRMVGSGDVTLLERMVVGADWARAALPSTRAAPPRLTLYGIKGGVGRSTAGAYLAWSLARAGKKVLVIDLDLESPGIGSLLSSPERPPEFGLTDLLVERGVSDGSSVLAQTWSRSDASPTAGADIIMVPAAGRARDGYTYLPKLSRAYVDVVHDGAVVDFAHRLQTAIAALEEAHGPDVTILDSRAGLHEIAAVAVTRLDALALLFAHDSAQTWDAYDLLFRHWQGHPELLTRLRPNLRVVAAQVPEHDAKAYLERVAERAYACFLAHLYEDSAPGEVSADSFDLHDPDAPHHPLPVYWSQRILGLHPARSPDAMEEPIVAAAFSSLVEGVQRLLFGGG